MSASAFGHSDVVKLLIAAGAKLKLKNDKVGEALKSEIIKER